MVEDGNARESNSDDSRDGADDENALDGRLACDLGDGCRVCDLHVRDAQGLFHLKMQKR